MVERKENRSRHNAAVNQWPYSSSWIAERIEESQERYLGHMDTMAHFHCVAFGSELNPF